MRSRLWQVLLFVLAFASAGAFAHRLTISPANATAGEELLLSLDLVFPTATTMQDITTRIDAQQIVMTANITRTGLPTPSTIFVPVATPGLEPASYEIYLVTREFISGSFVLSPPELLARIFVQPGAAAAPLYIGLNGNWFDTSSPGWGANIVQGGSRALFAGWFDYEARHSTDSNFAEQQDNTWRVMTSGKWLTPTVFRGILYTTRGTPSNQAWSPASLQVTPAGYLTLTFASATEALFEGQSAASLPQGISEPFQRRATIRRFQF